ncbi:hypothetical protein BGZ57DRAFT_116934 [Hyaloscypha finlandica]|nr:hypothetical protein BGZ57DRAFT_116934 [Hyaloscypha finlandica]
MRMIIAGNSSDHEDQQTRTTASAQSSPIVSPVLKHTNRTAALPPRPASSVTVRRNPQGLLRPFDASGNEVPIARKATPPRNTSAVSPGSESQSLRRKAILDGLGERDAKRARMQVDGHGSSPLGSSGEHSSMTHQNRNALKYRGDFDLDTLVPIYGSGSGVGSDRDGYEVLDDQSSANSVALDDAEPEIFDIEDNPVQYTFFDDDDQILRCAFCGHEIWTSEGFCTGIEKGYCRDGLARDPYFEELNPEAPGRRPAISATEHSEEMIKGLARRNVVGDYLDDDLSAYDSQDEADQHFNEAYDEQDSFIDDESQADSDTPNDSSSSNGETDWKEQYNQLQATYAMLQNDYTGLADEYDDFRRDVLGSDYNSGSDMEDRDENGMVVVDVSVPDPIVTELVLSQAGEQSQESEITTDGLRDSAEAWEAASSVDGWHNITMVSTQDNHTHPEVEL